MRYVIYGAGAIGGSIGARLTLAGHEVTLIARGAHLEAMRQHGLRMRTPEDDVTFAVQAVGHPSAIEWRGDEAVILCMKTQDTRPALEDLRAAAGSGARVICAQNGVDNERQAARRFSQVYGMLVLLPSMHLTPGEVILNGSGPTGVLDAGRFPSGLDAFIEEVCADLKGSDFISEPRPDIMRMKYAKLIRNLPNVIQAVFGPDARADELRSILRDEALAVFAAAGIDAVSQEEFDARELVRRGPVPGVDLVASSTWQSVIRGLGSIETDYLNGEISLLGNLHGVPTPANRLMADLGDRVARERLTPGTITVDEVMTALQEASAS
jgi:2-dehydropantoate 2-reductase